MMCKRYNIDNNMPEIHSILKEVNENNRGVFIQSGDKEPNQTVPILTEGSNEVIHRPAIWGLPDDYDKGSGLTFNVFTEHVLTERRYRRALLEHPIALPASCFYECKVIARNVISQYKCHNKGNSPVYLAGFYKKTREKDGSMGKRAVILTTLANKEMIPYQCRMPVLLKQNEVQAWLEGNYVQYFMNRVPFYVEIEQMQEISSRYAAQEV